MQSLNQLCLKHTVIAYVTHNLRYCDGDTEAVTAIFRGGRIFERLWYSSI